MDRQQSAEREDQRVRLTKALIRNAFLQLLTQKPVQNVTVKELCEAAGVNRGTFYLHYRDVYDLMRSLEDELLADLDALLSSTPVIVGSTSQDAAAGFISSLYDFFERNRELCAILLGDNGDKKFVADIIEHGRKKSVSEYQTAFPGLTKQKAEIFYQFIAWGFIGLIQWALQVQGGVSFTTVAAYAERIVAGAAQVLDDSDQAGPSAGRKP